MPHPIKSDEKSILLNWLHRFGSRFKTGFVVTDPLNDEDAIVFANEAFTQITGYSFDEVRGTNLAFLQGEDTNMDLIREIDQQLRKAESVNEEILNYKKDGTPFWNELVIQPIINGDGEILFNASFMLDVTGRKKNESLLKLQESIFKGINEGQELDEVLQNINTVAESFLPTGTASAILFKEANNDWTIKAAEAIQMRNILALKKELTHCTIYTPLLVKQLCPGTDKDFGASWSLPLFDSGGQLNGILILFVKEVADPTSAQLEDLKKLIPVIQLTKTFFDQQNQYRWLAYSDPETNLPNRHAFLKTLKKNLNSKKNYFVATIQPSEYTKVVDVYGRDAADELFIQLARRLEKIGRNKNNYVGRASSSSLVATNELIGKDNSKYYVYQLKKIVSEPFVVAGEEMFITLKTGISLSNGEEASAEEIFRRADVALTFAKRQTGNAISFYRDLQIEETAQEITIFNELTKALSANEIDVHLQPKVSLETSEITGFEALARWTSPVLGQVPPIHFIPVAENTGKIIELEIGVLTKVMKWLEQRDRAGLKMYQVAVNISVDHFFHSSFVSMLQELVSKYEIEPKYIRLEITESIGLVDFEKGRLIFNKLHQAGFEISIDDFGIGYSSLSYLPQLQVNELKIDRSFIKELDKRDTRAVVMTIIQLAINLNMSVVAEGIEKKEQIETLLAFGCKIGQGFYYYKPMPLEEIDVLLQKK